MRTMVGSISKYSATPAATPPITWLRERYSLLEDGCSACGGCCHLSWMGPCSPNPALGCTGAHVPHMTLPSTITTSSRANAFPHFVQTPTASSSVSYTHLRAHETRHDLVCRLLL